MRAPTFFEQLQESQGIFLCCPHCHSYFTLNDALPQPVLGPRQISGFERERLALAREENKLLDYEARIIERRDRLKTKARARALKEAQSKFGVFTRQFKRAGLQPWDLKPLHDPVRYVEFRGLSEKRITRVQLIAGPPASSTQERIQRSIEASVKRGDIGWQLFRCLADGSLETERRKRPCSSKPVSHRIQ